MREKRKKREKRREKRREKGERKERNRERKDRKEEKKREKMSRVNYYQSAFNSQKRQTKHIGRNVRNPITMTKTSPSKSNL